MFYEKNFKPNIEVLARIAQAFDNKTSMKKTHLHLASKVRWNSFVKYLDWLQTNNYVQSITGEKDEIYVLTESGREMFVKLSSFLKEIESNRPALILQVQ